MDDCIKLFEICAQMLNHVPPLTKAEFQIDQAQTYISYVASMGDYLGGHDKALLEKAEALVLQYHNCTLFRPEENRLINARVAFQLWEIYTALGKCEEAEKYKEEAEIFKREFGGEKRTWGE